MAFPKNIGTALSEALLGLPCTRIEHPSDWFWQIGFGDNIVVFGIESPWRLLFQGSIAFGDEDQGQRFGLPEPVDGPARCLEILKATHVTSAGIREGVGDLTITFDNGAMLEIFNHSSGYEGWSCTFEKLNIIALGGGELAISASA